MKGNKNYILGFLVFSLILAIGTAQALAPVVSNVTTSGGTGITGIVTLKATATDTDGFITKVDFLWNNGSGSGWVSIGQNTSKSGDVYSRNWDTTNVSNGDSYSIMANATDNNSEVGNETSSTFSIDNNQNPFVSLNSPPSNGDILIGIVILNATATDSDGSISQVIFEYDNGSGWELIGTGTSGGSNIFTYSWNTDHYINGSYSVHAKATDDDSAENSSSSITVNIANPPNLLPVVTINIPVGGQTYNGTVQLNATASDRDGSISQVIFEYNNGSGWESIGTGTSGGSNIYIYSWNTVPLTNGGNYRVRATATDNRSGTTDNTSANFSIYNNHPPKLSEDGASPPSGITPVNFEFTVKYTDIDNDTAEFVNLSIDGEGTFKMNATDSNDPETGIVYNVTKQLTTVKEYKYHFEARDINGSNAEKTSDKTVTVHTATYESGNRVWDITTDVNKEKYVWDAWSFSGFYYNLDNDEGGETLTISGIGWSLDKKSVEYKARPINVTFERSAFGEYYVIGFMAERYFAGYKSGSIGDSGDNLLGKDKLSKVLTDNADSRMVRAGDVLTLEEGYEFRILELDIKGNQALVGLFKDDWKVEDDILSDGDTLVYKIDGIPIIGIHINAVFAGIETSSVRVDGIFQISDEFTEVDSGEKFGLMTIESVDPDEIVMKNRNSISLSKHKGESFNLMGKINIEVGDSNDLRFAPVVDISEPGTYELRGTVTEEKDPEWTPLNFEGLLYDMDTGFRGETLSIERSDIDDRGIDDGGLTYTAESILVNFEHKEDGWDSYKAIGFMGEKYFAGYQKGSSFISSDRSLMAEERLGKILIDEDEKYSLRLGNPLTLQEGYSLRIEDISRDGDLVMIAVYKDGEEKGSDILGSDETLVYDVEVGGTDIPLIIVHIGNVFTGFETSSVFIDGVFQISEDFTTVESSDSYGKMKVTNVDDDEITMENDDSFSLSRGETINIMGDIKIKVADDSDVRFYPFLEVIVEEPEYLELEIPDSVFQNEELTMTITSDGDGTEDVSITFGDLEIGSTDPDGELTYTPTETGTFTVTASKSGYQSESKDIEVLHQPKVLEITAPLVIDKGEEIVISVTSEGANIGGASVKFGSTDLGTTASNGNITYIPEQAGTFTIMVSKSGYQDTSQDIDITDPAAKLVFTNLTIEPGTVQPGQIVNITAEAANFGTIRDSDTAILKINGKVEDTRELLLNPGESVTLSFTANKTKPGTYRVELNGRKGAFKVAGKGLGTTAAILLGIIAVLAAAAIIYSIHQGTLTTDVIAGKVDALKNNLKQLFEK